jgi:hypothetical protein
VSVDGREPVAVSTESNRNRYEGNQSLSEERRSRITTLRKEDGRNDALGEKL